MEIRSQLTAEVETKKIFLNSYYGKLGNKWSIFYSPSSLIHTTLTGQLSLLLLIEMLEKECIKVLSANTDGLTVHVSQNDFLKFLRVRKEWEELTGFNLEETFYKSLHSRDVNSYIATKEKGVKTKGAYALDALSKNPHGDVATIAVIGYLTNKVSIEETIRSCKDIRKFLFTRKVEGGANKDDKYLGRVVRWYYAVGEKTPIVYAKNGNKVSESEGGKPLMTLPDTFPDDVDYERYIEMGYETLKLIGV
jgi:hypothetical protein